MMRVCQCALVGYCSLAARTAQQQGQGVTWRDDTDTPLPVALLRCE